MIFKDKNESARLLADKIKQEELGGKIILTYIDDYSRNYCQMIADFLKQDIQPLSDLMFHHKQTLSATNHLIILDDGQTEGEEYNEFTDKLRKDYPTLDLTIAVPVIPQSEESTIKNCCDRLLTLHVEPLFFSTDQFYQIRDIKE